MLSEADRGAYHGEGRALLRRGRWAEGEVDQAIRLHDLLEVPERAPDAVARQLRARLITELPAVLAAKEDPWYRVRLEIYSSSLLELPDPAARRLFLLYYRGVTSLYGYQGGALGQLDAAIEAFRELDREIRAGGPGTAALPGDVGQTVRTGLAAACYSRYGERRELLLANPSEDMEREIRADLDEAIAVSERSVGRGGTLVTQASALATLGACYARRYEDDPRHNPQVAIESALAALREAARLAEAAVTGNGHDISAVYARHGIRDRLAGALAVRDTLPGIDEAISLYLKNRAEGAALGIGKTAGETQSLATAYMRRWMLTKDPADRERAHAAYEDAFALGEAFHLPSAFDVAGQWGGLAWQEKWWAEAGAAYQRATRVVHLAVRQQGSRAEREWILRKSPGLVASRAALALVRSHAPEDALVALETGRGVLLAEMFDRRALDYRRVAALAGRALADEYQRLTGELTEREARLLLSGPAGDRAAAAAVEEARRQRAALRARLPGAARDLLSGLDGPPGIAELRLAAGPATVVYLAATSEGGLALIMRPGGAPVEPVELPDLTGEASLDIAAALLYAVDERDSGICEQVCEELWLVAMDRLLPRLRDAAEVVLVPGGVLAGLPWHAARLPGPSAGHVLDHVAVSYMPNVRSLPAARAAGLGLPATPRVLAVEAPEPTSLTRLSTEDEIAAVCARHGADFAVTRLPGREATAARLRAALAEYEILHFAGHAGTDLDDPLAGALVLANDERLTIRELIARGTGATRFAVLSACETARVEDYWSDEMISFPTALMQCGLGGAVGALWAAGDLPTTLLMEAFYREWRGKPGSGPGSARQALRSAQQRLRDGVSPSPLTWANFIYVGP